MRKSNYEQIKRHLSMKEDFQGNSMRAETRKAYLDGEYEHVSVKEDDQVYIIFSYATPIASLNLNTGERWMNDGRYSMTTSRHQNLVRAYL